MNYKKVKELMTVPAIFCESTKSIKDCITIMKEKNIGFLPITKKGILIGVVTDRDILIRAAGIYKLNTKIEKIITTGEIHFVSPSTSTLEAAKIMSKNKIRRLVVMEDGKIHGVITTKNLLKESELHKYIIDTYKKSTTLKEYQIYINSNPHDSIKTSDYPL